MDHKKRKKIEARIIEIADKFDPSGTNSKMYKTVFKDMSDARLIELIKKPIPLYAPNGGPVKVDHMRNIEILKSMGYDPEQRAWLTDPRTGITSLTTHKHLNLRLPVRRQVQMRDHKLSASEHNRTIDKITGQTVGKSKGSSFSFQQINALYTQGYSATLREVVIARGGNLKLGKAVDKEIRATGGASINQPGLGRTHVKSTVSVGIMFRAMHIGNNMGLN